MWTEVYHKVYHMNMIIGNGTWSCQTVYLTDFTSKKCKQIKQNGEANNQAI